MISFTDDRLYVKGTCNVICSNPNNGDIYYQSNKMSTGSITPSTNLNEIRAGLSNPVAAMIPSDADIAVDFEAADFSMWAKSAQLGATLTSSAPAWKCVVVEATSTTLSIPVSTEGTPVAELGKSKILCYVQKVGSASAILSDNTAHEVNATTGLIANFTAVSGEKYKIWYHVQNTSARVATISSFIDPKVVRFEAQIAVYSNKGGSDSEGTRVGWLMYIIPYLKMQADATVSGDQGNNDTTKISGKAISYDSDVVSGTCVDCEASTLGYMIYVPDDSAESISGLAVIGGVTSVVKSGTAQIPVRFVMADGSIVKPTNYQSGFTYALASAPTGTSVSADGIVTAGTTIGDCDCTITYTAGSKSYTNVSTVSVVNS